MFNGYFNLSPNSILMLFKNNSILFWKCNGFPVLYETSFVPCVNKFITTRKKSYDIARHREVFLSQIPQSCPFEVYRYPLLRVR